MPTYQIDAPNGQTYQIDGPAGATQEEIQRQVLSQYPDAGGGAGMVKNDIPDSDPMSQIPILPTVSGINAALKSARDWLQPAANNFVNLMGAKFPDAFLPGGERSFSQGPTPELQRPPSSTLGRVAADIVNPIPQDLSSAGAQLGTMIGPGPLARVLLATAGAGAGKALEPGASMDDILKAAGMTGLLTGGVEGAGALGSKILRSVPNNPFIGGKRNIAEQDAAQYGAEMGRTVPELAGAQTTEDLRQLASGPGRERLGAAKERVITQIDDLLGTRWSGQWTPAGPGRQTYTFDVQGTPLTLRQANDKLSEIGARAFSQNPLDRNFNGVDQRQLYGQVEQDIEQGLRAGDLTGKALDAWLAVQGMYKQGMSYLKPLTRESAYRAETGGGQLNTPAIQKLFSTPKGQAAYSKGLGEEAYNSLTDAMRRGATPLDIDRLAVGSGGALDPLYQSLRSPGAGLGSAALGLIKGIAPNIGSTYAAASGRAPYALPPLIQQMLDMYAQRQLSE